MASKYVKKEIPSKVRNLAWALFLMGLILMGSGYVKDLAKIDSHAAPHEVSHTEAAAGKDEHQSAAKKETKVAHEAKEKASPVAHGATADSHDSATDTHAKEGGEPEEHASAGHHGPKRSWFYFYLVMFMFLLSISLGSMFWVCLEYIVTANWSTPLRRIPEFFGGSIFFVFLLALPLWYGGGMQDLFFHWLPLPLDDAILQGKGAWLNESRFVYTGIGLFVLWFWLFKTFFFNRSIQQDDSGDQMLTAKMIRFAPKFMVIWGLTLSVAAIDWMMSLNPHWFSTMWGVYYFAGTVTASLALILFVGILLFEKGYLHPDMKKDSFYSMSTFLFAFNCFWAYIAFCQFMLIWYSNMPEETQFFFPRWEGAWQWASIMLVVVHFVIPVFMLVPRRSKTNLRLLKIMSVWLLLAHIFDLIWLIMPSYPAGNISLFDCFLALGFLLFIVGFLMLVFIRAAGKYNLVPIKDPRLGLGLGFRLHTVDSDE